MSAYRSPFERLRQTYETDSVCGACGHHATDSEGGWRVSTTGSRVRYQFVCPVCEAVETRELHLGD